MPEAGNPTLVCLACGTEFLWDESPADDACAECAARRAQFLNLDEQGDAA